MRYDESSMDKRVPSRELAMRGCETEEANSNLTQQQKIMLK
jgi:hypothetical protein